MVEDRKISAVIFSCKPDERLKTLASRLLAQTVKPDKILVINTRDGENECSGLTAVKNMDEVMVMDIEKEKFDRGSAGEMAMGLCEDSDYVLMMTQDALPKNKYLTEHLIRALMSNEDVNAVAYARQEPDKNCNIIERYINGLNYPEEAHSGLEMAAETNNSAKAIFSSNVCAMYNRKLYDEAGGFPQHIICGEDIVFAGKALKGDRDVLYEPKAAVIHSHNYTGMEYLRHYFDMGVCARDFSYILGDYHSHDNGMRMFKDTAGYLIRRKEYIMIAPLIYYSICKFLGYNLGRQYKNLPESLIMKLTANKEYWRI